MAFVTTCSVLAIVALVEGKTQTPRLVPRLDHQTSFFDLFTAVPVIVTAYTFHFNGNFNYLISINDLGIKIGQGGEVSSDVSLSALSNLYP